LANSLSSRAAISGIGRFPDSHRETVAAVVPILAASRAWLRP